MNKMRLTLFVSVVLVVLAISAACAPVNQDKEKIRGLIGKYNFAIVTAYRDLNMEPLKAVTVEFHFNRINGIIEAYLEGDEIMESKILKLTFNDMKIEENKAIVRTSEDWEYRWLNVKTKEVVDPWKDIHYELAYHLVKKDGKWLVDKVEEVPPVAVPPSGAQSNAGTSSRPQSR